MWKPCIPRISTTKDGLSMSSGQNDKPQPRIVLKTPYMTEPRIENVPYRPPAFSLAFRPPPAISHEQALARWQACKPELAKARGKPAGPLATGHYVVTGKFGRWKIIRIMEEQGFELDYAINET